jgi:hypothetical protein
VRQRLTRGNVIPLNIPTGEFGAHTKCTPFVSTFLVAISVFKRLPVLCSGETLLLSDAGVKNFFRDLDDLGGL